jgi:regulator of protease activity HflC (stomatin/prohibitin superfamily)
MKSLRAIVPLIIIIIILASSSFFTVKEGHQAI